MFYGLLRGESKPRFCDGKTVPCGGKKEERERC